MIALRTLFFPLVAIALVASCSGQRIGLLGSPGALARAGPTAADLEQLIFFAVLEGLYTDGVSNEVVDRLTELDEKANMPLHFIYSCPICMPALNALRVYQQRPRFFGDKAGRNTFGKGLSAEIQSRLLGENVGKMAELQRCIERWVRVRLSTMRLRSEEQEQWTKLIEEARKKGQAALENFKKEGSVASYLSMKSCAMCEGAYGACRPRD